MLDVAYYSDGMSWRCNIVIYSSYIILHHCGSCFRQFRLICNNFLIFPPCTCYFIILCKICYADLCSKLKYKTTSSRPKQYILSHGMHSASTPTALRPSNAWVLLRLQLLLQLLVSITASCNYYNVFYCYYYLLLPTYNVHFSTITITITAPCSSHRESLKRWLASTASCPSAPSGTPRLPLWSAPWTCPHVMSRHHIISQRVRERHYARVQK